MDTSAGGNRIVFVDDELDNYHTNVFLGLLRGQLQGRGYTVAGCTALQEESGRKWADQNAVPYFSDVVELNRRADCYMVLAPSTAHTHLSLCRQVVPFGKPVWVDKTFAPDLKTAQEIFALADRHQAPLETASALRYTAVQNHVRQVGPPHVRHMVAWGAGGKLEEYLIHPVELIVSCMGTKVDRLMRRGPDDQVQILLDYSDDRTAVVNVYLKTDTPFAASVSTKTETRYIPVDGATLFADALAGVLDFFDRRAPTIYREESLVIRRIIDVALNPGSLGGWVKL